MNISSQRRDQLSLVSRPEHATTKSVGRESVPPLRGLKKEDFCMAEQAELEVAPRTVMGKANKRLRKAGLIPGNITGHNQEPQAVQIDEINFDRVRRSRDVRRIIE